MKGKNDLLMSHISKWTSLFVKKMLQCSCRFHDLQLLHLTAPFGQWNMEDLIWTDFGRILVTQAALYALELEVISHFLKSATGWNDHF
jgi:hypothetical protein